MKTLGVTKKKAKSSKAKSSNTNRSGSFTNAGVQNTPKQIDAASQIRIKARRKLKADKLKKKK